MTKYTVIHAATKRPILLGATLAEARRFCFQFRGHYLVPAGA